MAIASCLVDTNILLRIARRSDPRHKNVDAALARLAEQRTILHYRDQNIAELWSVMTRPIPAMASAESPLNGSRSTCHRGRHDSAGGQRFGLPGMAKDGSAIQRFQGSGPRRAPGSSDARSRRQSHPHAECWRLQPFRRPDCPASRYGLSRYGLDLLFAPF